MSRINFKYNSSVYENEIIKHETAICQSCLNQVSEYCTHIYTNEDVNIVCLECIASGKAAEKFDGQFVQSAIEILEDKEKTDELFKRTPGYASLQGEEWQVCCDDYCTFLGEADALKLHEIGVFEECLSQYASTKEEYEFFEINLRAGSAMKGYLFRCLHCGKYHFYVEGE